MITRLLGAEGTLTIYTIFLWYKNRLYFARYRYQSQKNLRNGDFLVSEASFFQVIRTVELPAFNF